MVYIKGDKHCIEIIHWFSNHVFEKTEEFQKSEIQDVQGQEKYL